MAVDISDLPVPPSSALPAPTDAMPDAGQAHVEEETGVPDTRTSGIITRGMVKGASSILTLPADLGIGVVNFVKKYGYNAPDDQLLQTNASGLVEKGLDKFGLPKPRNTGEQALDTASSLVGGMGIPGAGAAAADATGNLGNTAKWWKWASANGGQNEKIGNNLWARALGITKGADKLTTDVIADAHTNIQEALDIGRKENNIIFLDPAIVHADIGEINGNWTSKTNTILDHNLVDKFKALVERGAANGEELGDLSSQLGKAAKSTIKNDHATGAGLFDVKEVVDNLIKDGIASPGDLAAYETGLKQYRTYKQLYQSGALNAASGNVNLERMAQYLNKTDEKGFFLGGNNSPHYAVTKLAQQQMGNAPSMLEAGENLPQKRMFIRALARTAPTALQTLTQRGIPATIRSVANNRGFLSALSQELAQPEDGGEEQKE